APDPAGLEAPELERGAAVAAVPVEQPDAVAPVAEQDEVLAEHPDRERHVGELGAQRDRVPVAAQQLAAVRPSPDVGELRVLATAGLGEIAAESDRLAHRGTLPHGSRPFA